MMTQNSTISGAQALAQGAIDAGVTLVTGYPGAPVTAVVDHILRLTVPEAVHVAWNSNEKVAIEMAFGAAVGGMRALLCVKSVGLNVALDPLMAFNLSGCNAGLVLLVGDDPGGWGSQNEQDSRGVAWLAELPLLEPTRAAEAQAVMREAFRLSEEHGLPVIVRFTRALASSPVASLQTAPAPSPPPVYQREFMRWVVLPVNVVPYHRRLLGKLDVVRAWFEDSTFNAVEGTGPYGVVAAGGVYQKLVEALGGEAPPQLRLLRLGTLFPLPEQCVVDFLRTVKTVLVLEETSPWIEDATRAIAQQAGITTVIAGRRTGHMPPAGEVFAPHIAAALNAWLPALALPTGGATERPRPSREALCESCPYIPTVEALLAAMDAHGGRDAFIVTGDPGCMVRAQLPPYTLLDVKHSLGSSIGLAAGLAVSQQRSGAGKRVIALVGDSGVLHSGLAGLVDAVHTGAPLTIIILDNGTTALSGGQPHPASGVDARRAPQRAVDLAALVRACGVEDVFVADIDRGDDICPAVEAGLQAEGVAVVIACGKCRRWE
ncbi:MAG: thiamine pyrophosphate-dependent enzyme [Anaerolineae bacterium]